MTKIFNWIKNNKIVTIIIVLSSIIRFFHVDYQSLWLDELITMKEVNPSNSLKDLYNGLMITEPHPPLYFLLLHFVMKIFGFSSLVARLFSAIIGVLGVVSIYYLGKEIYSKKAGIFAAILLSVNYFHIYYSQEARMYSLLFLVTVLSFLYLIKFIKKPNNKSALLYCLFSTIMIYVHFFSLFTFVSQYVILLYFIINPINNDRIKMFKLTFLSGISTIILFLPTIELFKKTSEIKSFWVQAPTIDVYTQFFKDYFGQSEIVIFFVILLLLFFYINLFKEETNNSKINPETHKLTFVFIITSIWIFFTLLLPLIRSYLNLPMLINRYFINLLPAFLILIAIGLEMIKSKNVKYGVIGLILIFSITDITIVKDYYYKTNKTQFREVSEFIIENNKTKDPVVCNLSWSLPYYFKENQSLLVEKNFEDYIVEMKNNPNKINSFWYLGAFGTKYELTPESMTFLQQTFIVENSLDRYDSWTKHFIIKTDANLKRYNISENSVVLSNLTDDNWEAGVGKSNNMFLLDYAADIENKLKNCKLIKFKDGSQINIIGFEKSGNFIHLHLEQKAINYVDKASYPNKIELLLK